MMRSLATALHQARTALAPVSGELAALEVRLLAQAAWGVTQEVLVKDADAPIDDIKVAALQALVSRRMQHEPMAQILGVKHFWKSEFIVSHDVLTPRADSETIIEMVLRHRPDTAPPYRILDLGTGSGCLLLSLLNEYPNATGWGVDVSPAALHIAKQNAGKLGLNDRAWFRLSDWCRSLNDSDTFDIVVSNPPYIPRSEIATLDADVREHEPHLALDGGNDGLDCYRALLSQLKPHLASNALVACETGFGQARMVEAIATSEQYTVIDIAKDLAGTERVVVATLKAK